MTDIKVAMVSPCPECGAKPQRIEVFQMWKHVTDDETLYRLGSFSSGTRSKHWERAPEADHFRIDPCEHTIRRDEHPEWVAGLPELTRSEPVLWGTGLAVSKHVLLDDPDEIEQILLDVWAGGLDAGAFVRDEGGTEEEYLRYQRHTIGEAKTALKRLMKDKA